MNYGKKLLCVMLCLLLITAAFQGCSRGKDASSLTSSQPVSSETEKAAYTIGLLQFMEYPSFNTVREAFMSRLEEWNCDESLVKIDYQNAGGDEKKAEELCQKFVKDKVDLIVAISDPAVNAAVSAVKGTEIQVLAASAEELGPQNAPAMEGNVTGVLGKSTVSAAIDLALQGNPALKTLGLLYDPQEPVSKAQAEEAKKYCGEKNLAVEEVTLSVTAKQEEAEKAVSDLCGKVDAVFTPISTGTGALSGTISKAMLQAKKPWYAGTDALVQSGALAAVSLDYGELGRQAADLAVQLVEGKPVSQISAVNLTEHRTYVNQTTLDAIKAVFPEEILGSAHFYAGGTEQ